ncbi:MAG TPA: TerD family protein [Candidatus Coprocola pullicola]|nr:TerD family protein [Candidatus Coprocola pullicola]
MELIKKLYDDRYFVFYNQSSSPNNAIVMNASNGKSIFKINISRLPSFINKLVFCVTSDDNALMGNITKGNMILNQNNVEIENFSFQGSFFSRKSYYII